MPTNNRLIVDHFVLNRDKITEANGILSVPATIARHLIQTYGDLKVLKPAGELEAAAKYADGIPITRDHPPAGIVTDRAEVLGFLRDPLFENDEIKGILEIADKDLAADVKDGTLTGLSIGFFCNLDHTKGTVGDSDYDAIQKDIFLNHVAVVPVGRCSTEDGCGFHIDSPTDLLGKLDTAIGMATNEYGSSTLKELLMEIKEMVKETPAGDTKPETDVALEAVIAERDLLKAERDGLTKQLTEVVQVEKDAMIKEITDAQTSKTKEDLERLKLDELKKEVEMVRELRTGRLSFKRDNKSMTDIDKAYAGIGRDKP